MIVGNEKDLPSVAMEVPGAKNVALRVLVSPAQGWQGWVMRVFDVDPDGYSPRHIHDWPHINYILEGRGILHMDGTDTPVQAGSYAYVPANIWHQYKNVGQSRFRFICIVPERGHSV